VGGVRQGQRHPVGPSPAARRVARLLVLAGLSGGVYLAVRAGLTGESLDGRPDAAVDRRLRIEFAVWVGYVAGLGAAMLWWWRTGRATVPRRRRWLRRAAVTAAATPVALTPFLLVAGVTTPRPPMAAFLWEAGGWLMFTWIIALFTALLLGVRAALSAGLDVLDRYSEQPAWSTDPDARRRYRLARIAHLVFLPFALVGLPVWAALQIDSDLIPADVALPLLAPLVLAFVGWGATGGVLALMERRTRRL